MFELQEKIILWVAGTAVAAIGCWYVYHSIHSDGVEEGRAEIQAEWDNAEDAKEADFRAREADLRQQAMTLSFDLLKYRDTAGKLQQEIERERSKGTIVVEVPGKCPELGPGFVRLWDNAARGTPAGATGPDGSAGAVPGAGADPAH